MTPPILITPRALAMPQWRARSSSWGWMWTCTSSSRPSNASGARSRWRGSSRAPSSSPGCRSKWPRATPVHTVYEACGFGYTFHQLTAAGAHSLVTTSMRLSPERRRKNDRLDARELCVRLSRHLDGQAHELKPIRIPTMAEQERRELGRLREFFKRELRRLENHGRALRLEFEHQTLPAGGRGRASGNKSRRSARSSCVHTWSRWSFRFGR